MSLLIIRIRIFLCEESPCDSSEVQLTKGKTMSFLEKLSQLFSSSSNDEAAHWVYLRCSKCGEKLRTRVNLYNDLSIEYDEGGKAANYICRKTVVGSQGCFQRLEVVLKFDSKRKLFERDISGGSFIEQEEYFGDEP